MLCRMDKTFPQTLRLLDAIETAAPSASSLPLPEGWEGRPDQWCAHLDRLCKAQGLVVHPDVIAQAVLDASPSVSGALAMPRPNRNGLQPMHGFDPNFVEHPTIAGWEKPCPASLWERKTDLITTIKRPSLWSRLLPPLPVVCVTAVTALAWVNLRMSPLSTAASFAGMLLLLLGLRWVVSDFEESAPPDKASAEQVEAWNRRRALWRHVPGVSACLAQIDASGVPLNAHDAYCLERLLVAEEQRQSRNLTRLRRHPECIKREPVVPRQRLGAIVEEY